MGDIVYGGARGVGKSWRPMWIDPELIKKWIRKWIITAPYKAGFHDGHDDIIARDYRRYRAEMAYLTARLYYGRDAMRE
jgi:hypothetical protein